MSKLKILLLLLSIIILFVFLFFYFAFPKTNADVQYSVTEISSKNGSSKLYIKWKTWGMTSDNQLIVISSSKEKEFTRDTAKNYIYEGLLPLLYKTDNDTLFIYTIEFSSIPKELITNFKIVQVKLENPEMMTLLEHDNYKAKGLTKID